MTTIPGNAGEGLLAVESAPLDAVTADLYRNIHKGIRNELFGVTIAAGSVDPGDQVALEATYQRMRELLQLLLMHAEHEETFVQPVVTAHAPKLAARILDEHHALDLQMARLEVLGDRAQNAAVSERRLLAHQLYLGLASFTAEYLQHQTFEELEIGPALCDAVPLEELVELDHTIVASIPPDRMAAGLSVMLPAMNLEDRTEMLMGMKFGAPPEVFAGVQGLAQSVLASSDFDALAARLAAV